MRGKSEITVEDAAKVKAYLAQGYGDRFLADLFNVTGEVIRNIRRGKTYKYVSPAKDVPPLAVIGGRVQVLK